MISPSLYTVLAFSIVSALMGLFLLRIGIRGKLISPNPHCRKCKFDLQGHDLSEPLICPECGNTLIKNNPSVINGLRKTRKLALLVSIIFLLTAATGFAWPKLSKLPSIQSINIYDHFPEPLLTKLATTGDDQALQTLHDRLIPGQVSDNALQTLIDHAFKLQADESTPWDQSWGDVLLYAFLEEAMTDQQLHMYLERTQIPAVYIHKEIGPDADKVYYSTRGVMKTRGESFPNFVHEWHRGNSARATTSFWESPFELESEFESPRLAGDESKPGGATAGTQYRWRPYVGSGGGGITHYVPFPLDQREINVVFPARFTVRKDDKIIHSWEIEVQRTVRRVEHKVVYGTPIVDTKVIERILKQIYVTSLPVPTQLAKGRKHERTRNSYISFYIHSGGELEHGILGEIFIRLGDLEIPYNTFSLISNTQLGISPHQRYLRYFGENDAFWKKAVIAGKVDLVIKPRPDLLESRPAVDSYINKPIVFRDVPIEPLVPGLEMYTDREGVEREDWRWVHPNGRKGHPKIHGEIYDVD